MRWGPRLFLFAMGAGLGLGMCLWGFQDPSRLVVAPVAPSGPALGDEALRRLARLPDGFSINTYADGLTMPRMLRFTARGDLLVSAPRQGAVVLLEADADGDGRADGQRLLLSGLDRPHGLDVAGGWIYVAESGGVLRVAFDARSRAVASAYERIVPSLPMFGLHWTRSLRVGPDQHLYVSVGSSCNACIEAEPRRAALLRYGLDGSGEEIYATGLRNAVGFAWRPGTGEMYATENGRDGLGEDLPPDELNRIVEGGRYGWPFASGERSADPELGERHAAEVAASLPPAHLLPAHVAPLGITFYDGATFPARYRGAAFVALHGSREREHKSGYQVVALFFDGERIRREPFLGGLFAGDQVFARPVDVAVGPDGALYVSDDFAGAIYRIAYLGG